MPQEKSPGPSVKDPELYESLREDGNSKEKAARIANAAAGSSRSEVGRRGGGSPSYEEWTVDELRERASELDVEGRSSMTKDELEPYADRVRVVETATGIPAMGESDVVLYDTFGQAQGNVLDVREVASMTGAAVVLFSWNLDATLVAEALRRGASGYLSKTLDGAGIADAVVRVAAGERVLPGDRGQGEEHGAWPGQEQGLSAREAEMMALITQGYSNAEIAERSYLSINSVKTYIRTAYRKLGLTRRSQAVRWGLEHGFLPPEPRRTDTARGVPEVAAPRP